MTANWKIAYDTITFTIEDKPYYKVLVDRSDRRVVYPEHEPEISDPEKMFYSWSASEGDYLPSRDTT
jgi:hypothetical protein